MPTDSDHRARSMAAVSTGLILPVLVMLSLLVVVVPVPPVVLDFLLAGNITASILLLLATLFTARPLQFSAFPSLLLLTTLARLVLNVASTRLVLTRAASHGTSAAGEVIHTFAKFVAQDQLVVGLVIFSILVVIQLVVVTRGATRLSEVAARFALDGMPGRQMAVDADLNAGLISAETAGQRRAEITAEADFHAAMDGAGKFVRGDAMAGIIIALVNLIGGIAIGVLQYRMAPVRALEVFALLTVGDGLVAQIPSFLIGLSAALLATRSSAQSNLSQDVIGQTFQEPATLFLASATTLALVFTGLPAIPLLTLSAGCALAGEILRRRRHAEQEQIRARATAASIAERPVKTQPRPEDQLAIDPIELELGFCLIRLASSQAGGDLMERVSQLRHRMAHELGILIPKVKIRDSLRLKENAYRIKLRGVAMASGEVRPDGVLAVNVDQPAGIAADSHSIDPATGKAGNWVAAGDADRMRELGYSIVDPSQVVIAHLADVIRSHADELLTREHVHQLLDNLRSMSTRVVDELIPSLLKPSQVHRVLCNLLRERVPIRDLETILESLGDDAERTKDPILLTETARHALGRTICQPFQDATGAIRALTLDPALEQMIVDGLAMTDQLPVTRLTPQATEGICREVTRLSKKLVREGLRPVLVCGPKSRSAVRSILANLVPGVSVIGLNEIPRDASVRSLGQVPLQATKVPVAMEMPRTAPRSDQETRELVTA